jgi:hypothetical protein
LRSHIDHYLETWIRVHNLQRGAIRRRYSWKVHEILEEMVMATVRMGEHVQTMGRQAATVVVPEVIAIVIASLRESAVAE